MLTLAAYLGYVRRPSILRYLLLLAAFALGLMSKVSVVTLPVCMLLLDYWPLQRWRRDPQAATPLALPTATPRFLVLEKLPLFALVLAACIVAFVAADRNSVVQPLDKYPLYVLVLNALEAYVIYGAKNALADALGGVLSPPRQGDLGCGRAGVGSPPGHFDAARVRTGTPPALSYRRLALVFGDVGADDWSGAGERSSPGRSL